MKLPFGKLGIAGLALVLSGCLGGVASPGSADTASATSGDGGFIPHVIVGVNDVGINPYHHIFYRPALTEHPCTYIREMPCDIKELRLTLGTDDWDAAFEADKETWAGLERNTWYWIPQTVFVAVWCETDTYGPVGEPVARTDICLLDDITQNANDFPGHGTGVTSIIIQQNPDALIAFLEGGMGGITHAFAEGGIPVDVASVSYGPWLPAPSAKAVAPVRTCGPSMTNFWPLHVQPAGNFAWPIVLDCTRGDPRPITVGGGGTAPTRTLNALSSTGGDVTSYFCHAYAHRNSTHEMYPAGGVCGTSWATPAVAGALSKVILALRQASGHDGGPTADGMLDPNLGISTTDLRNAMNLTASYTPAPGQERRPDSVYGKLEVPVNPAAPWLQWGWGFYDGDVANATIAHLLGTQAAPDKPAAAKLHMESVYTARRTLYG